MAHSLGSPKFFSRSAILAVSISCICVFAIMATQLGAQEDVSQTEAMHQRAQVALEVATEQFNRKLYQQAQASLKQARDEYLAFMSEPEIKRLEVLEVKIDTAIAQRNEIARSLDTSDKLAAEQRFLEARSVLNAIKRNKYLTKAENVIIRETIVTLDKQQKALAKRMRTLFDISVELYKGGSYGIQLRGADFTGANFSRSILRRAYFLEAVLQNVDFTKCDLRDAAFVNSDIRGADFSGAKLSGAGFYKAVYDHHTKFPPFFNIEKQEMVRG